MVPATLDDTTLLADGHHEVSDEDGDVALNGKCVGNGDNSSVIGISEVDNLACCTSSYMYTKKVGYTEVLTWGT